jgi:enamine deaminase RidA (YjgF/YER057c/UK114 family)
MARKKISSGSKFEALLGYSRAVRDGEWVFLSGTTGFDYKKHTISKDVVAQTEQMLDNMEWGLKQAGASFEDIVRLRLYMVRQKDFERMARAIGKRFGHIRPANTMITSAFADPRILVEMDATALVRVKRKTAKRRAARR